MTNTEIEVRFVDINKDHLIKQLHALKATDHGEDFFKERIFYDRENTWREEKKVVRIRETKNGVLVAYKHHPDFQTVNTPEIEFGTDHADNTALFLEAVGLKMFRHQEKKRHSFYVEQTETTVDIDIWPKCRPYVELEGHAEENLKSTAALLQLDWEKRITQSAAWVIEEIYKIPVRDLKYFTFEKIE